MKWSRVQQTSARCSAAWVRKQDENWRVKSESVHVEITSAHTLSHKAEAVLSFRRLWFRLSSLTLGTDPWTGQLSAVGPRRALWDAENIPGLCTLEATAPTQVCPSGTLESTVYKPSTSPDGIPSPVHSFSCSPPRSTLQPSCYFVLLSPEHTSVLAS